MSDNVAMETKRTDGIKEILNRYDLGELVEVKSLAQGYANENLLVITHREKVLYRVCKQQPLHLIEYEVRLMQFLRKNGIKTAFPIADKQEEYVQKQGKYHVMLYDYVAGTEPKMSAEVSRQMGEEVGKLSNIRMTPSLEKKNAIHLDNCHQLISEFGNCKNPMPEVFDYFSEQTNYLTLNLDNSLPYGIVHGDLFPNNTIFQEQELKAIIDFEEACSDQLMFDVGMTVNGFCFVDNELRMDLLESFLSGYNAQRSMTAQEWLALPLYMQWGSHGMLSWHLRNDLINRPNQIQYERVVELMQRTRWLRANEEKIQEFIRNLNIGLQ